jgi:3-isopropylmalate dehydrogenase
MAQQREFKIGVLAGDGIGPEITDATIRVLRAASERSGLTLNLTHCLVGWKAREQEGTLLPEAAEQMLRASDGWIMGPTFAGEYPKDDHTKGHPSGYLRRKFKLFANVRPVRSWPQLDPVIPDLDVTIIRENTEGFYPDRNLAWGCCRATAQLLQHGVAGAIESGTHTADLGGNANTSAFLKAAITAMRDADNAA